MRRTALHNTVVPLSIPTCTGEALPFGYRRYAFTGAFQKEHAAKLTSMRKKLEEAEKADEAGKDTNIDPNEVVRSYRVWFLSQVMASWDYEEDDGKPVPISEKTLGEEPLELLAAFQAAIEADLNPNPSPAASTESIASTKDGGAEGTIG